MHALDVATLGAVVMLAVLATPVDADQSRPQADEFVVVVNTSNPATSVSRDRLSRLLLKRIVAWPDGLSAEPVDLPIDDPVRSVFTRSVHGKSVGAVRAFWQQQIFSGRDVPPPEKATAADVLEFVSTHMGAVGYVPTTARLGPRVKAIAIDALAL